MEYCDEAKQDVGFRWCVERGGVVGSNAELFQGDGEQSGPTRIVVSRSHTPPWVERFADVYGPTDLVRCGSVGYKASRILLGEADMYIHKRGLKEWDTCAPEVIDLLIDEGGYDPTMGARPMRRTIERLVEGAIADRILTGEVQGPCELLVSVEDGAIAVTRVGA